MYLFNVLTMTWTKIKTSGEQPDKRASHSATLVDQKIYVFGGCNFDGEPFSDIFCLDLGYMASS